MKRYKLLKSAIAAMALSAFMACPVHAFEMIDMVLTYDGISQRYYAPGITLQVNGTTLADLDMPPVILNDYTMVPAREVFEKTGAVVDWNGITGEVFIGYGDDLVLLRVDSILAEVNNEQIYMDVSPKIINNKTMIPARFAAEALGFKVGWNPDSRIVTIDSAAPEAPVTDNNNGSNSYEINEGGLDYDTSQTGNPDKGVELARDISAGDIPEMSYPETAINGFTLPGSAGSHVFTISASSEISKVNKFLLNDNRLVIDIYNAQMNVSQTTFDTNSPMVSVVRIAQNQMEPEKITRVVLELESAVDYAVSISDDRKNIYISFERVTVNDVTFNTDGVSDYIYVSGSTLPSVSVYPMTNPDRVIIDVPYATMGKLMDQAFSGRYATWISTQQYDDSTARITLNVNDVVKYTVTSENNMAVIKIEDPTFRNIRYNSETGDIILNKAQSGITASGFMHQDNYTDYQYILSLPGDYSSIYGYGEYVIKDASVYSLVIDSSSGVTRLIINERGVNAVQITEDGENIYIKMVSPKSVYSKIIVIDPGHGGKDQGTNGFDLIEKDVTLDISLRLAALLEQTAGQTGIKVYCTRTDDTTVSRFDRAPFANAIGDLFVSVHINSAKPNETPNGTETYYHPHANDETIGISTKETADIIHKHLLNTLGLNDRKVKQDSYTVILETIMPSVLCEIAFVSNPEDAAKLGTAEFRQLTAQALYNGIMEVFSVYTPQR